MLLRIRTAVESMSANTDWSSAISSPFFAMFSKRTAVVGLFKKGTCQCDITCRLGMPKQTVSDTVRRYRELGHNGYRPGRSRKRTVNTLSVRQKTAERINGDPGVSIREIVREIEVNRETLGQIAEDDFNLKPYRLRRVQLLTDEDKVKRLQRCRLLNQRAAEGRWVTILFTDEKLFTVKQSYNPQNDKNGCSENPGSMFKVERRQCPKSVTIWAGICATGKSSGFCRKRGENKLRSVSERYSGGRGASLGEDLLRKFISNAPRRFRASS